MRQSAVEYKNTTSCLIFSRQTLPHIERNSKSTSNISKGGYILSDGDGLPDVIVIATGSEVQVALEAARQSSKKVRVVSMPSCTEFDKQEEKYREMVLPPQVVARVAVEAAVKGWWYKYVGLDGIVVGMSGFGESASASELFYFYEINVDSTLAAINLLS